jgi:hypothetical protein
VCALYLNRFDETRLEKKNREKEKKITVYSYTRTYNGGRLFRLMCVSVYTYSKRVLDN